MVLGLRKYTSWIILDSLNYLLFFIILTNITSYEQIEKIIKYWGVLCVVGIIWSFYFFTDPRILDGIFLTAGMGSNRGTGDGLKRIFTPSMTYVSLMIVYFLSYFFYSRDNKSRWISYFLFLLAIINVVLITSVRTYMVGIILSAILFLIMKLDFKKTAEKVTILILILSAAYFLASSTYTNYITERISPVLDYKNFDISGALGENPIQYGQAEFGSLYWRLLEAGYVLTTFDNTNNLFMGNLGKYYSFMGMELTMAPHISYIGILYLYGIIGVVSFLVFIIYFTIKLIKLKILYKNDKREYLVVFLLAAWLNMLLFAFGGGIFFSTDTAILGGICGMSLVLEKLYKENIR